MSDEAKRHSFGNNMKGIMGVNPVVQAINIQYTVTGACC